MPVRTARQLVAVLSTLEGEVGVAALTPEFRLLLHIMMHGPTSSLVLSNRVGLSPSGFHLMRRRLQDGGLIFGSSSADDRRHIMYDLTPHARSVIAACLSGGFLRDIAVPAIADNEGGDKSV